MSFKRGKAATEEIEFVRQNLNWSDEKLSAHLNRSIAFIKKYKAHAPALERDDDLLGALERLHISYFWRTVKGQLLGDETSYFEQQWIRYWEQFSQNEILATDEVMMKDAIILDIMVNRALNKKSSSLQRSSEVQGLITVEYSKSLDDRNQADLARLETQYAMLQAAIHESTKEHLEYQKKKDDKMTQLKATRDQRLKQIEQSGKNFWDLLRQLNTKQARLRDSIMMEKMKIASDRVYDDFTQSIQFADGEYDKPFLTPEGEIEEVVTACENSTKPH